MTLSNHPNPATRRERSSARAATRWGRRRGVLCGLAGVAVLGFAAAYAVPTGSALAESAEEPASQFASAAAEAQSFTASGNVAKDEPTVVTYAAEYRPPPPPPPPPAPEPAEAAPPADDGGGGGDTGSAQPAPDPAPPQYNGGGGPAEWMTAAGIPQSDWGYVDFIVSKESGWNPNAVNSGSGASGLVQALPCSKVPGDCFNPVDNLRWASGYAIGRYGSWAGAYAFWSSNNWW